MIIALQILALTIAWLLLGGLGWLLSHAFRKGGFDRHEILAGPGLIASVLLIALTIAIFALIVEPLQGLARNPKQ